ncbi:MAG: hypothetical protein P4L31_03825, partial [Candidatus Babeliales bacterium]|nr:hypothetical protein [Candidatus Babeliales bacterium]
MLRTLKSLFLVGLLSLSQLALAMNPGNGKGSPSNKPSHQNFKADKSERSYSRPAPNQEKRQDAPSEKSNSANSAPSSKPTPTIADILRPERSYSRPAPTQERRQDAPSEKSNTTPASQASNKVANTSTPNSSPASASSSTSSSTPKNTASAEAHFRPIGQAIKEFQERNDERSSEVFKASLTKKREEASRQESTSDYDSSRSCSDDNLSHGSWNRAEESSASTQSESTQSQSNSSWFAWRTMASSSTPATQAAQKPVDEGNKANVSPNAATPLPVKSQKQFTTPLDYLNPKITLNHEQVKETEKQDPKTDAQLEADRKTVAAAVLLKARYIELITEQPQHHPLKTPATNPSDTPATLPAQNNEPKVNKPASKPKDKKAKKGGGFWSYLGFSPSDPPADLGVHSLDIFNEGKEMRTWGEEERRQQAIEQAEEHYRQEELKMAQTNNGYFETASEANQRAAAAKQQKEAELQAKHKQDEKDAKQAKKAKKAQNKKIWDDAGKATKLEQKEYEDRIKKEAKENPAKAKQAKKDAKQADEDRIRRNTDAFNRGAKNGGPLEFREPVKTKPQPNAPKVAPKKDQPVTPQPEKPKPAPVVTPPVNPQPVIEPVVPPVKDEPTPAPEKPTPAPVITPPVVPPVAPQPEKPKPAPQPEKPKVNPKPVVTPTPVESQDRDSRDDREAIDERDKKTYEPENFSETIAGKVHDWLFPAPQTSPPLSFANLNPQNG